MLDIGAWVGPTALFSAALGASVVAVEADPAAQERFNLAANPALAERIVLIRAAATPDGSPIRLGAARKRGDSMSSALLTAAADTWDCPGVSPQALLDAATVRPERGLVVKIDIEGGEYVLVPALAPLLPACTRAVLLAVHPRILEAAGEGSGDGREATSRVLSAFPGWSIRVLEPGHDGEDAPADAALRGNITLHLARPMLG